MFEAKKECWYNFLEDIKKLSNFTHIGLNNKIGYSVIPKYIKLKFNSIILALIKSNNKIVVTI